MVIKDVRIRTTKKNVWFSRGNRSVRYGISVLVDKIPEEEEENRVYTRVGKHYYSELEGMYQVYEYIENSKDGFGGREITLNVINEGIKTFKGTLWDDSFPPNLDLIDIFYTDNLEDWDKGHTRYAGIISKELIEPFLIKLGFNIKDNIKIGYGN